MNTAVADQQTLANGVPLISPHRQHNALSSTLYEVVTVAHHCWCGHGHKIILDEAGEPRSGCLVCSPADLACRWKTFLNSPATRPDPVSMAVVAAVRLAEDVVSVAVAAPWVLVDAVHIRVYDWMINKTLLGRMLW
jgi:hypothetical protein